MRRAGRGLSAPVAMGVAIAFAVSWKPFVKSKKSASAMTSTTVRVTSSTDNPKSGTAVTQVRTRPPHVHSEYTSS